MILLIWMLILVRFFLQIPLIPFVDHNDEGCASVATNQQRQALPLLKNDAPLVGTGLEGDIVKMTHAVIKAEDDERWSM